MNLTEYIKLEFTQVYERMDKFQTKLDMIHCEIVSFQKLFEASQAKTKEERATIMAKPVYVPDITKKAKTRIGILWTSILKLFPFGPCVHEFSREFKKFNQYEY